MKTARRQELRTNELSVQIEQISETVKQNYTALITVVVGAAVVIGGIYWYINSSRNRLMDAWSSLSIREDKSDAEHDIARFEDVIAQNLNAKLTAAAQLKIGDTALSQFIFPTGAAEGVSTGDTKWLERAQNAYTAALASNALDRNATARAIIHLGIIAEDRGDFDKAAEQYRRIINDTEYAGTPFFSQAEYRLKHLENWRSPVVFAPPPPKPIPTTAAATTQPAGMDAAATPLPLQVPPAPPLSEPVAPESQPAGH